MKISSYLALLAWPSQRVKGASPSNAPFSLSSLSFWYLYTNLFLQFLDACLLASGSYSSMSCSKSSLSLLPLSSMRGCNNFLCCDLLIRGQYNKFQNCIFESASHYFCVHVLPCPLHIHTLVCYSRTQINFMRASFPLPLLAFYLCPPPSPIYPCFLAPFYIDKLIPSKFLYINNVVWPIKLVSSLLTPS